MKLISLNIWGGKIFKPLLRFLKTQSHKIDIFCFQEVLFGVKPIFTKINKGRVNIFSEITSALKDFSNYKYLAKRGSYFGGEALPLDTEIGQTIFIRKSIEILSSGGFRTYSKNSYIDKDPSLTVCGNFQYLKAKNRDSELVIGNLHGLWQENTYKMDTPERIEQAKRVKNFFDKERGKKILVGDFNLRPDTESMKILESTMHNLIREYNIKSTRSELYSKEIKFSDYILVSSDIVVKNFRVLKNAISDHLPLLLEFD